MVIGNQYKIVSELGSGGMGVVYQAVDIMLEREIAIKKLRSEFSRSPEVAQRFLREAKIQARLNHPNITQLYTCLKEDDLFYIVMEFVAGTSLSRLIPLPFRQLLPVLLQALDSLEYAHGMGVLHRDIKPDNLMVTPAGTVKIMDFGIAHVLGSSRQTREKMIMGTLEYISPERITGKDPDRRSDIYSLGAVIFEALTGRLPFQAQSEYELLRKHMEEEPPKLRTILPDCPEFLEAVVTRAMAKDPDQRYRTCREMREVLVAEMAKLPGIASADDSWLRRDPMDEFERTRRRIAALVKSGDLDLAQRILDSALIASPGEDRFKTLGDLIDRERRKAVAGTGSDRKTHAAEVLRELRSFEDKQDWSAMRDLADRAVRDYPEVRAFQIAALYVRSKELPGQ